MLCIRKIVVAFSTVGALSSPVATYGQELPEAQVLSDATDTFTSYGSAGDRSIFVNATRGSCLAERVDETSAIQMGITDPADFAYLGVFTLTPTDLQAGETNEITIEFGESRFVGNVGEAAGNIRGGFSGGYVISQDPTFIQALAAAPSMVATVRGREPIEIDLTGTAAAIDAVRACNSAQTG